MYFSVCVLYITLRGKQSNVGKHNFFWEEMSIWLNDELRQHLSPECQCMGFRNIYFYAKHIHTFN
jgi:hypothetical protein